MSSIREIKKAIKTADKAAEDVAALIQDAATAVEDYIGTKSDAWVEDERGEQFDGLRERLTEIADALGELSSIYADHISD